MSRKHGASQRVRMAMVAEETLCDYIDRKVEEVRKAAGKRRIYCGKRIAAKGVQVC